MPQRELSANGDRWGGAERLRLSKKSNQHRGVTEQRNSHRDLPAERAVDPELLRSLCQRVPISRADSLKVIRSDAARGTVCIRKTAEGLRREVLHFLPSTLGAAAPELDAVEFREKY